MKTKAIYAGSFDPFTIGHLDIVRQALAVYDEVVIAIGNNFYKSEPLLDVQQRQALVFRCLEEQFEANECKGLTVRIFGGPTVDFALGEGATHLIRGARNAQDEAEFCLWKFQCMKLLEVRERCLKFQLFFSDEKLRFVSSSDVKMMLRAGEFAAAQNYLTPVVFNEAVGKFLKNYVQENFPNCVAVDELYKHWTVNEYAQGEIAVLANCVEVISRLQHRDANKHMVLAALFSFFVSKGNDITVNRCWLRKFLPNQVEFSKAEKLLVLPLEDLKTENYPEALVWVDMWEKYERLKPY